jgi:CelD/BcsL family acetyltransferase involved in cellulose biosynthesis
VTEAFLEAATDVVRYAGIGPVVEAWDALADELGAPPFLRPGWFVAWVKAFATMRVVVFAAHDSDGRVAGVLPLLETRRGLAAPANWHTPEFGLVARPGAVRPIAGAVAAARPVRIAFQFVDADDPLVDACAETVRARGYRVRVRTLERSPYVSVTGSWADYEARRGRKLLGELRRRRRRLEEEGRLTFDVHDGADHLDELLAEGLRVEAAGWKGARGSAILSRPSTTRFYTDVASWASRHGWLRLAFLRLDGRAFAFDYGLEYDGVHYLLKTGYDPAYRSFAPGLLLRRRMIARAFEAGLDRYDFLGVDMEWKREWTDESRPLELLESFAPSPSGTAWWLGWRYARPAFNRARDLLRRARR